MAEYQVSKIYEGLKESDLYILTEFLKMLGNPTRIRILLLLIEQDTNVSNLAEQLGMTQSAVSHQLNLLNVTALDGEEDQIKGLDLRADDYITMSKQMADMEFGGLCPVNRTDEVGVLSHSLNDLSKKLAAALSELQEANQKLQADIDRERQLERQRVEFFASASHELKTPITIIKGQLQGMLYQVGRYKDRETYLSEFLEVTDTLEKMVQDLLTISRLDTPGYICKKAI